MSENKSYSNVKINVNMEARMVNLDDWVLFGGGASGLSYNHKSDDSIVLKMNRASKPVEDTLREYQRSKALYQMGLNCPKVLDFVTDGERFGLTVEKVKNKKSFSRLIADDPQQLEAIAREFAQEAKALHQIRLDPDLFPSFRDKFLAGLASCKVLSEKDKHILSETLDKIDDGCFCIHGDMNPGNIIKAEGKNYWIDLGDVSYGDPDIDFADLIFAAENVPYKVMSSIFHFSKEQFVEMVKYYGQEYYGERWGTEELNDKLQNALIIKMGNTIIKRPLTARFYRPFIRGQKFKHKMMICLMNLLVRKY